MPIDRGQIFLDIISEMIAEQRAEMRTLHDRLSELNLELVVLNRLKGGESAKQILATGNEAIFKAVGRLAAASTGRVKVVLEKA